MHAKCAVAFKGVIKYLLKFQLKTKLRWLRMVAFLMLIFFWFRVSIQTNFLPFFSLFFFIFPNCFWNNNKKSRAKKMLQNNHKTLSIPTNAHYITIIKIRWPQKDRITIFFILFAILFFAANYDNKKALYKTQRHLKARSQNGYEP